MFSTPELSAPVESIELEAAMLTAYNRWMADHCAPYPTRLKGVMMVSMRDMDLAVKEIRRCAAEAWVAGICVSGHMDDKNLDHPFFHPIWAEAQAAGKADWFPPPVGPDFALSSSMAGAWFGGAEARRIAGVIVSYQTPAGGWSKAVDMTARNRLPGESYSSTDSWSWIGTFDNGATTEELRFLGAEAQAQTDTAAVAAFKRGLAYIFRAQFPNGCWPQVYPLAGSYHDAATFNDKTASEA